jgi:tetratricopeptide (TPR) repeat protein
VALTEQYATVTRAEGDRRGLAEALLDLSVNKLQLGDVSGATAAGAEAEQISRQFDDPALLARVLASNATQLGQQGRWVEAERVAREAELTARAAALPRQAALALGVIGTARREQGDLSGARAAHTEELATAERAGDDQQAATAQTNLGNVAIAEQRYDEALQRYAVAESVFRRHDVPSSLLPLLANRAQIHHMSNRLAEAVADYAGAAEAAARMGVPAAVRQWADPAVELAYQLGDVASAERLWSVIAPAARATGDDAALQRALGERALLLINRAQPTGAAADHTNVDQSLLDEAEPLLAEQDAICRRTGDIVGLAACIGNRAIVQRYRGDLAGSLACIDEQLDLARRSNHAQGVLFATANRGEVLGLLGRIPEALEALNGARATAAQYNLVPMVQQLDQMIAGLRTRN